MIKILFDPKTPVIVTMLALIAGMIAVWFAPSEVPIHFMNGQADRLVSRWVGLFSSPLLMIVLLGTRKWIDSAVWVIYVLALLQICIIWISLM